MKMKANILTMSAAAAAITILAGCGEKGAPAGDAGAADASAKPAAAAAKGSAPKPAAGGGGDMVLKTEIPPQRIEGTPMPIKVPGLEAALKAAPKVSVPAGTTLLSKGKPVTGSDDFPIIGELELITDGEKDAGEGYYVELMDGLQWVQIDLEASHSIEAIWVWHFHSQARAYHDVIVQVSDDEGFASGVTTLFNNDYDGTTEIGKGKDKPYVETRFGKLIDANGTKGRYVRLYNAGNTSNSANHYIEVEVYGK
jgi:hypothetical protein